MPGRRRPFEDNWTGGLHLADPTGQVQGIRAGVAGSGEVTAHSPNILWWRVGRLTLADGGVGGGSVRFLSTKPLSLWPFSHLMVPFRPGDVKG